jgi:diguanylate cyclase (GGDEF)-like protein
MSFRTIFPPGNNNPPDDQKPAAASLADISRALDSTAWVNPMPTDLRAIYDAGQLAERRVPNRVVLIIMAIFFDLYWLANLNSAPTLLFPSLILRAGLTGLVAVFVLLDRHNRLGCAYGPAVVTLAVIATLISALLFVMEPAANTTNLTDVRSIPLILMGTGLVARLTPWEAFCNAALCVGVFIGSLLIAPSSPHAEITSLVLMDLAVGSGVVFMTLRLETRDRRVFLLQACDRIHRAELVARNHGLLLAVNTDGLTGAANRRCFDEVLDETWRIARERNEPVGLIMIDIDHFKLFNDHHGHKGGDDCLRRVVTAARHEARKGDLFARYGGEEFAVILPLARLDLVLAIAERMRLAVERMRLKHAGLGDNAIVTVSFGAASMVPLPGNEPIALLEAADFSLYAAKRGGRNRVAAGHSTRL